MSARAAIAGCIVLLFAVSGCTSLESSTGTPYPTQSVTESKTPTAEPTSTAPTVTDPVAEPDPTSEPTQTATATAQPKLSYSQIMSRICAKDPQIPQEWKSIQDVVFQQSSCFGPMRYVDSTLGDYLPDSNYSGLNIEMCKAENIQNSPRLGFVSSDFELDRRHPSPDTVFQVIPVYTNDASPSSTPKADYGKYFDFLIDWIKNSSDVPVTATIRVPDSYFYLDASLSDYPGIERHQIITSDGQRFVDDVMELVDPSINFSDVDMTIMVVPPETDNQLFGTNGWAGTKSVYDGNRILVNFMQTPIDLVNDERDSQVNFSSPYYMLHEMHHAGYDYGDHGEKMKYYGLMSTNATNLVMWEKWLSGFISDSQVACLDMDAKSTVAIAPSEVSTSRIKMAVIPLSATRLIVLESVRAVGYSFKMPEDITGLIVYEIDLNGFGHGEGETLLTTPSLKAGQSIEVDGIIISVTESGQFGDLVTIN